MWRPLLLPGHGHEAGSGLEHAQQRTDVTPQNAGPRKREIAFPKAREGIQGSWGHGVLFFSKSGWMSS